MTQTKHTTQIHYRQLQADERGEIQALYEQKKSEHEIARCLHRSPSTISRELKRGTVRQRDANYQYYTRYFADSGQINYQKHRANCHAKSLLSRCWLFFAMLVKALKQRPRIHSVDSFVHAFRQDHPGLRVPSTPTVYRYIDCGQLELKNTDLPEKLRRHIKKPGHHHVRLNQKRLGTSIEQRPAAVQKRQVFGDWEGDLVKGKRVASEPAILTLTERYSRYEIMVKLPDYQANTCRRALQRTINHYGATTFNSITFDNGSEFAKLNQIRGTQIYFAHPYAPWERGTNENHNGLIREFVPKGQSLHRYSAEQLHQVQVALNHRPRRILDYATPAKIFSSYDTLYD